ncbi:MAG: hypothetical protein U0Q15_17355 [Kineosporiaceae bacterium]
MIKPTRRIWRRLAAFTGLAAAATTLALTAGPATTASAATVIPCGARTTAKPFQQFGDSRNYFALQGGTFEGGASGWNLYGNAAVTAGNNPFNVWGYGASSLKLGPNATAVSPTFCVDPTEPFVRFVYKAPKESGASLKVNITIWRGSYTTSLSYWAWGGSGTWQASPAIDLPVAGSGTQTTVSVTFQPLTSSTAVWQIDDFSVDPWKSL